MFRNELVLVQVRSREEYSADLMITFKILLYDTSWLHPINILYFVLKNFKICEKIKYRPTFNSHHSLYICLTDNVR